MEKDLQVPNPPQFYPPEQEILLPSNTRSMTEVDVRRIVRDELDRVFMETAHRISNATKNAPVTLNDKE